MSQTILSLLTNWALILFFGVGLVLLVKSLNRLMEGAPRQSLVLFGGLLAWGAFSIFLVFTVIVSGLNHAGSGKAAVASVYIAALAYTLAGIGVLIVLFLPRRAPKDEPRDGKDTH